MTKPIHPKPSSRTYASVTITTEADGLSEAVDLTGLTLSCVQMSTAWTSAQIGFQGSVDLSTNYYDIYNTDGDFLTYDTSGSRIVVFDPAVFAGIQRLKLVSESSAGVAVAQTAERVLVLGLSEYVEAN